MLSKLLNSPKGKHGLQVVLKKGFTLETSLNFASKGRLEEETSKENYTVKEANSDKTNTMAQKRKKCHHWLPSKFA